MKESNSFPQGPYQPQDTEKEVSSYWIDRSLFKAPEKPQGPVFSMVMPPPNITSSLHLGHALDLTLPDVIARYKRLKGFTVCWFPGTDQAGIATHNVVERSLEKEGIKREDLGREAFIEKVWEWKENCGNRIIEQIHLLGASADWSRLRFTKDPAYEKAIRHAFVTYYNKGLIYRGHRMVHYCPRCSTALSDIEVDFVEEQSFLYYIGYPVEGTDQVITVATTRPETMLGDSAVAVHPDDERYRPWVGKNVLLPLTGRKIPIIADSHVEKDFGTGALKITPAHDPADFIIGKRHHLPEIAVIQFGRSMNEQAGKYQGLSISKAREVIVHDLEEQGFLQKKEPYVHSVGHCSRCNKTVEPTISEQWFLKTKEMANETQKRVELRETRFIPDRWVKVYRDWMENIQDWCISRQIWWGVQIPVWYCSCGKIWVDTKAPESACSSCGTHQWTQDEDVLDTWFGSALWPFAVMGWPDQTTDLMHYYPSSLLVTGFDIIFFWVARMLFAGVFFTDKVPFQDVYFHGLIRDSQGRKMSKSLNNGIDPAELIESYGADALRFTLISLSTVHGQDICVDPVKLASNRNFINKIWNASRFVLEKIHSEDLKFNLDKLNEWDQWILLRWNKLQQEVITHLEAFKFNEACSAIYSFFWDEYCDWYIEVSKFSLNAPILLQILRNTLILMHPFIPFITEKLWQYLPQTEGSIMCTQIPVLFEMDEGTSQKAQESISFIQLLIKNIRHLKSEFNLAAPEGIKVYVKTSDPFKKDLMQQYATDIQQLAKIESFSAETQPEIHAVSSVVLSDLEIYLPLSGLIDIDKDMQLKHQKLEKIRKDLTKLDAKMQNQDFLTHAPASVIEEIKLQHQELKGQMNHLEKRITDLGQMKA